MRKASLTIPEIVAKTGVPHPNPGPYRDCSAVVVAWNEEERIGDLLRLLKTWFDHLVIGVQASTDRTLSIAQSIADRASDQVLEEPHHGYGDASMPRLIGATRTSWSFVVACDEWPSQDLLESLWSATAYAHQEGIDSYWIPFLSITEGVASPDTQAGHLRLFHSSLGWPKGMHSRPRGRGEAWWPHGHITHTRSLDEMMQDYLRYYDLGQSNAGWKAHNILMMHDACSVIAQHKGWDFIVAHEWWPKVASLAFSQQERRQIRRSNGRQETRQEGP